MNIINYCISTTSVFPLKLVCKDTNNFKDSELYCQLYNFFSAEMDPLAFNNCFVKVDRITKSLAFFYHFLLFKNKSKSLAKLL